MTDPKEREDRRPDVAIKERGRTGLQKPRMFRVILLNDDFTPMEFVIVLVQTVFRKACLQQQTRQFESCQGGPACRFKNNGITCCQRWTNLVNDQ